MSASPPVTILTDCLLYCLCSLLELLTGGQLHGVILLPVTWAPEIIIKMEGLHSIFTLWAYHQQSYSQLYLNNKRSRWANCRSSPLPLLEIQYLSLILSSRIDHLLQSPFNSAPSSRGSLRSSPPTSLPRTHPLPSPRHQQAFPRNLQATRLKAGRLLYGKEHCH